jgi:2-polyprenyl-6-methoxyphenol hydroxylase-like FAD-dependent oxidoreductase
VRTPPTLSVLIAGAGPVGLTAAIELSRRGVAVRIVDPVLSPPFYAKAVGLQPRTMEILEGMGVLHPVLDAGIQMRGQIVYVNGQQVARLDLSLPDDIPFGFLCIPQYETERILREELARRGVHVERGTRLAGFEQDADGVTATLLGTDGRQTVRAAYLIGADGAHSAVRKGLGLAFEGAAFEEQYMLGDVEVDWSMPRGYAIRAMHQIDGVTDDLLVCIPLAGRNRYRMAMLVPDELRSDDSFRAEDGVEHGFSASRAPDLPHLQAVIDRLSPEPTVAHTLRWSSVFKISHRIVDAYRLPRGSGRVFVAGDAAHIHPPTGAQGMNTGIQDAHNLAWKLALALSGDAAAGLLASYDAERRPVGEEVVGRTVRNAREGIGAGVVDTGYVVRREAQLLIDYADSPIVGAGGGTRAPDARGLTREAVTAAIRLFSLLSAREHTLLLYAGSNSGADDVVTFEHAATAAVNAARGSLEVYLIAARDADVTATVLPLIIDGDGDFARQYLVGEASAHLVRPDGYLAYSGHGITALLTVLQKTFA